ncbi:MAG: glycosyltransferase family 2 protein [Thermomicrobiales bacterium]
MLDQPPAPATDLSIAIVSWNTRDLLLRCLAALPDATSGLCVETIVVDNGSTDGTPEAVRARFPAARVIEPGRNLGFAGGNNRGLAAATGRMVCLLNPDTEPRPGALVALVAYLDTHPTVGAAGPRLLNPDGSEQAVGFRFPTLTQIALDFFPLGGRFADSRLNGRYPHQPRDRAFPIDFPLGACIVARCEAVAATGPLDEGYFMYSEEVDWCRRMRAAGWEIVCLPTAEVIHWGGQSTAQASARMFIELHRSRLRYYRRFHGAAFVAAARLITRAGALKETLIAWRRYRHGDLPHDRWRERVRACGAVFRLGGRG